MKSIETIFKFVFLFILFITSTLRSSPKNNKNHFLYISLRDENTIAIFKIDSQNGDLYKIHTTQMDGQPAPMTLDPQKQVLYVGQRGMNAISSYRIDRSTGFLNFLNMIPIFDNPVYLSTDKTGNYILAASYGGNKAAIYAIQEDGTLAETVIQIEDTDKNPHSILTDATNQYLFIPNTGADKILQFRFDESTGRIEPNLPAEVITDSIAGPRHFIFHGTKPIVYFVNEKNSTVTAYHLDEKKGVLSPFQSIATLPEGYEGQNTCADIHITPDDRFLYASNRGHDSIAAFKVDKKTGKLTTIGQFATQKKPREFDVDPTGRYLFAAGEDSDSLATYRINQDSGKLKALNVIYVGHRPSWVLAVEFEDQN